MSLWEFFRSNARWLSAGAMISLSTGFGQTFFISIYAPYFREDFGLSHGEWGGLYMIATICSAIVLTQSGRLSDFFRARTLAVLVILGFAAVCVGISLVQSVAMLGFLVFGLRFCGQGMLSHISVVAMGKWFRAGRARALAISHLGFSAAEAIFPAGALLLIPIIGWRYSWLVAAALLLFVAGPIIFWLLQAERSPQASAESQGGPGLFNRHWTRPEMMRHWLFWAMLPGLAAPSWVGTTVFFQIAPLTEEKGWGILDYAATAYPAYSIVAIVASFAFGVLADRKGVVNVLPLYLLGWAFATILLGFADSLWMGALALGVAGTGTAAVSIIVGAIFAELYGAKHLGGIKALFAAASVLSSALGPGLSGVLLDAGIDFSTQCIGMGAVLFAISGMFIILRAQILQMRAEGG
ncbi:MAG: MFS transporter [Paracoccaceae bacterium]|nr:MFS transporter [Paracoccaceae bacterium]MDG1969654.1 MFS transporter [Paracoccaceae bacterium]